MNGPQARNKWFDIIHGEKGTAMGRSLLKQDLIDHHDFQFFLDDKEKWLPMVESLLQDEVYITGTIVKQLTAQANLPGKMKFFVLQALGSKKIDQIADKWIACSNKNIVQPALDFIRKDNHLEFISAWLDDDPYYNEVNDACSEHWAQPCGNYIDHYYGVHVHDWLADYWNGPERYGLTVNVNVINYHYSEYVGGCFLAGTMVLAEEHKEMPIEDLQENDLILGRSGDIAVISNENAGVTLKVDTPAFGFNDDEPFFLSSHPFWSQDGWRALNPQTAKDENDWLEIGQLRQGDYVCKVKSINGNDIEYEWVKIKRVNIKVYPAGTRFHGIHTREGPRSYHANRYLVMQNYPEITIQRVADRLSKVDKKTQNRIRQQLKRLTPTFKHALGNAPAEAIASLAEKRVLYELTKSSKGKKSAVHSKDFTLPLFELKYDKEVLSHGSYTMPSSLKIHRRQLFVDKQFVEEKFISEDKEITWCRKVNGSLWEHGCIKLHGIGFYGKGFIALTKSKNDTDVLLHAEVKAHFKVNIFNCYKSKEEVEVIEEDKKEIIPKDTLTWEPCGSFEMGLKFDPEVSTWSAVDIGNLGGRDNLGGDIKLNTNDQDALVIDATIRPKYAKYAEHIILYAEFDGLYRTFQGYCTEYDVEAPDFKGKSYGWKGIFDKYDEYDADDDDDLEKARQELLKSKMHSKANIGLTTQHIKKELQLGQVQVHSNMVAILRSQVKTSLSLDDLFTLTGPDQKELHSRTFALLEKCMRFEMADEDREAVLGDAKPDLNSDERAVADAHKDFIGTRFAHCYLMNALGNQEAFDDRISETRKNQLLYFFGGDDDEGCLARDIDYNSANNEFARLAFIQLCPRVKDYMNDDGPGWADKLYDYITTPEKLLDFAMMTQITQDTEKVQKQSMVLYCLDPDRDLAKDFYNKVMMTKLQYNFDFFNGNEEDVDDMIDICGDILQLLINKILADDDKEVTGEIAQQCQQELKELQDELVAHGKDLMTASIDFVTAVIRRAGFEGDFWDRYFAAGKAVLDEMSPKIAGKALKWLAGMVLPAFAFIYTLKAFIAFDVLPPEQKASVIMDASYAALSVINKGGPKLVNKIKECFNKGKGDFKFVTMLDDAERTGVTLKRITTMVETAGEVVAGESFLFLKYIQCKPIGILTISA